MQSISFVAKGRSPDSTTMANESSIEFPQGVYDPVRRVQLHQVPLQEIRNLFPETPALTLASVGSHPRLGSGRKSLLISAGAHRPDNFGTLAVCIDPGRRRP
ncbi:uncharacterized protein AKAW2_60122A [Aspergillus luchuensis]|uniref:Uncharacterized protein n=1 Tax=Aspergillus kawachii TaxID=1069201 RepID=A0A7R8ACQ7_ASPKA|nr:uncharacterized protein AKAW2_60122A [Aspergillus luchuensis]BCS01858.1 hypothetical protein AKAW2_60122A [Aspergillus luchuensis]BCS13557.1 hypothetical protein ALUC_60113A [Aspergillus luchuensis]